MIVGETIERSEYVAEITNLRAELWQLRALLANITQAAHGCTTVAFSTATPGPIKVQGKCPVISVLNG